MKTGIFTLVTVNYLIKKCTSIKPHRTIHRFQSTLENYHKFNADLIRWILMSFYISCKRISI